MLRARDFAAGVTKFAGVTEEDHKRVLTEHTREPQQGRLTALLRPGSAGSRRYAARGGGYRLSRADLLHVGAPVITVARSFGQAIRRARTR